MRRKTHLKTALCASYKASQEIIKCEEEQAGAIGETRGLDTKSRGILPQCTEEDCISPLQSGWDCPGTLLSGLTGRNSEA